jgi:uncharacterized protein YcgI (DUF1989 family)
MKSEQVAAPGKAVRVELAAGDVLRIESPEGGQGGDMSFLGFDQAMTRNAIGWARYGKPWLVYSAEPGDELVDGDGVPVLSVGPKDGDGANDIMYPGCWSNIYEDGRPGCRDLISAALGIERREITGMLSFMCNADPRPSEFRGLAETHVKAGDYVSFVALRDAVAAVSACPDDELPGWRPAPLRVTVTAGESA